MAKEDFCFTYYDGDAARDMQHMDRLCRGAYNDLVIMQRKVGRLTMKHIKMVLGGDFEKCWHSLEIILKTENEQFWIEWVEISVEKGKKNSEKNRKKVEEYWKSEAGLKRKKILNGNQNDTVVSNNDTDVIPLGDGDGNEIIKKYIVPEMILIYKKHFPTYGTSMDLDAVPANSIAQYIFEQEKMQGDFLSNQSLIVETWDLICDSMVKHNDFYAGKPMKTVSNYISQPYKLFKDGGRKINGGDHKGKGGGGNYIANGGGGY